MLNSGIAVNCCASKFNWCWRERQTTSVAPSTSLGLPIEVAMGISPQAPNRVTVPLEANFRAPFSMEERERMARRRFQDPQPRIQGNFWYLLVWQNTPGVQRKRERIKLAPASTP